MKICIVFLILPIAVTVAAQDYPALRKSMVQHQLKERDIKSKKVLDAMLQVERHLFVPPELAPRAYEDNPLPIGEGQTISQPYIVAFMTEALQLNPTDTVLEIGTGSGYQAAVLSHICSAVYTIELNDFLAKKAKALLDKLGYKNINFHNGDGYLGWPDETQFDCIIVTCSPSHVPDALLNQLKSGGRMIIPVGERYSQELILLRKSNGKLKQESVLPVMFVPMKNQAGDKY